MKTAAAKKTKAPEPTPCWESKPRGGRTTAVYPGQLKLVEFLSRLADDMDLVGTDKGDFAWTDALPAELRLFAKLLNCDIASLNFHVGTAPKGRKRINRN